MSEPNQYFTINIAQGYTAGAVAGQSYTPSLPTVPSNTIPAQGYTAGAVAGDYAT